MKIPTLALFVGALIALAPPSAGAGGTGSTETGRCGGRGEVVVQVLGSGGPELARGRASSSYLVWHDGRARVLVDLGAGAMLRFGEAGARLEDLELVALSHLHVDHAADLPALVKRGFFIDRSAVLPVVGPGAGGRFPGTRDWLVVLFDPDAGPFRYLGGALSGTDGQFELAPTEVPMGTRDPVTVHRAAGLHVTALPVPHGPVPALSFSVSLAGRRIVFGGDQTGQDDAFWAFARDADLLVAHMAIPMAAEGAAQRLHATPERIGAGAAGARVRRILLSHLMTRSEASLPANLAALRTRYGGPVSVASDLDCQAVEARLP